jgi:hypothetical protein
VYEFETIQTWFKKRKELKRPIISPMTGRFMGSLLIRNNTHKTLVQDYIHEKKQEWRALVIRGGVGVPIRAKLELMLKEKKERVQKIMQG